MMNSKESAGQLRGDLLERICASYSRYYNVKKSPGISGIDALAEFHLHDEQYFLVKKARLSEADVNEFVYFAVRDSLDSTELERLCDQVWEHGLAKAVPKTNHRSSDVTLVILAGSVTPEAARAAKKRKRSKTYKFGFWGYSHFRLVVYDLGADTCVSNSMGASHKKAICNIVRSR